jgi:hypothetical protein
MVSSSMWPSVFRKRKLTLTRKGVRQGPPTHASRAGRPQRLPGRAGLWASCAVILIAVAATVSIFSDAFVPDLGYVDEWVYVGMAEDYWLTELSNYKHSRLTWLLPLAAIARLWPTIDGYLALQAASLALGALSALALLRRIVSPSYALAAGIFAVMSWSFAAVGGATYHNTLALPLVATMAFALVWAADRGDLKGWMVAGGVGALLVHANLLAGFMLLYFVAVLALWQWAKRRKMSMRAVGLALSGLLGGAVAMTVMLGFASLATGQTFLFWWTGLETAVVASTSQGAWYLPVFGDWLAQARYLYLPVIAFIAALVLGAAVVTRKSLPHSTAAVFPAAFLVLALSWVGLHAVGVLALQPDYFAIQLQYPALLAIFSLLGCRSLDPLGQAIGSSPGPPRPESLVRVLVTGLGAVAALLVVLLWRLDVIPFEWFGSEGLWTIVVLSGLAVGCAAWVPRGRAWLGIAPAGILLVLSLAVTTPGQRAFAYVEECWGSKAAALDVVRDARNVVADVSARNRAAGRSTAVVVSGSSYLLSPEDDAALRQRTPFAYMDGTDVARCWSGWGLTIPIAVVNTIYAQWPETWFVPVPSGQLALSAIAVNWDTSRPAREGWSPVIIAPSEAEVQRLVREMRVDAPEGARYRIEKYAHSPFEAWVAWEERP